MLNPLRLCLALNRDLNFALITEMVGSQDDLGAKVEAQGDLVRKLKADKADKAKVSPTTRPIINIGLSNAFI